MLMNIECSIVQSVKVALTFDNNKTKEREIAVGDLCYFEYNGNGKRKTIEGKVIKIGVSNTVDSSSWYIVVDGSLDYSGQTARFSPNLILDVDVIQKHDSTNYVSTPNDSTAVSAMRVVDGALQVSTDGGYSWMTPSNASSLVAEDDDAYGEEEVRPSRPKKKKTHKKPVVIEEDEDDYPESDDDTESDSESYYDEDLIEDESY